MSYSHISIVLLASAMFVHTATSADSSEEKGWRQVIDQSVEVSANSIIKRHLRELQVNGTVKCNGKPAEGALLKLFDVSNGQQTMLVETTIGQTGDFRVEGSTHWEGPGHKEGDNRIEPELVISYQCNDGGVERRVPAAELKAVNAVSGSWPDPNVRVDRIQGQGNFEAGVIELH